MQKLLRLISAVLLVAIVTGCAANRAVTVVRSDADWVKIGPDVRGRVYIWDQKTETWTLSPNAVQLPEGWVAGPEPK